MKYGGAYSFIFTGGNRILAIMFLNYFCCGTSKQTAYVLLKNIQNLLCFGI